MRSANADESRQIAQFSSRRQQIEELALDHLILPMLLGLLVSKARAVKAVSFAALGTFTIGMPIVVPSEGYMFIPSSYLSTDDAIPRHPYIVGCTCN